jgi:hypothetical protein
MIEVDKAEYAGDYRIRVTFNNGRCGTANLEQTISNDKRPLFVRLRDKSDFKNFNVDHHAVIWFDTLDLASEYLFFLAFRDDPELQEQFRKWGYIP